MICKTTVKKFCSENISLIENYNKAIEDVNETWHCHHKLEIQNNKIISKEELIKNNLYYNRPANELIFLTRSEHQNLHASNRSENYYKKLSEGQKGRKFSQEHKERLSKAHVGKKPWNIGKKLDSSKMKWYNNGEQNVRCENCPEGFVPGRLKYNVNIENVSKATKETRWYNNGIRNIRAKECPEGFVLGRLPLHKDHAKHISEANKGIKYWNNGEITIKAFECPKGFVHGMLKK